MFELIPWFPLIITIVVAILAYIAYAVCEKEKNHLLRKERLAKILIENRDSYVIDKNGFITVKDEAILKAVKEFGDKMNKRKNNDFN